jgi:hypothetical protein
MKEDPKHKYYSTYTYIWDIYLSYISYLILKIELASLSCLNRPAEHLFIARLIESEMENYPEVVLSS